MSQQEAMAEPNQSTSKASGILQRKCDGCRKKKVKGKGLLQRRAVRDDPLMDVPPIVHEVLRTPGAPLDPKTQEFMEPRFGYDFSRVRVHTDAKAAESARAVNALAYTVGQEAVFGDGRYLPETYTGRRLLAHELTHVVQQPVSRSRDFRSNLMISRPSDGFEQEADRASSTVIQSADKPQISSLSSGCLMRTIAYDPDCQPRQDEVQGNVSRAQSSAARWARAAIVSLASTEDVGSLLRRHFGIAGSNATNVGRIRSHFETIAGLLDSDGFTYHCRPSTDVDCQRDDGSNNAGFAQPGVNHIYFCDPYPYQNFFGHKSLIETLLHEAAHAHDGGFNHDTYEWAEGYPGPDPLTNADSYSSFARDVSLGRSSGEVDVSLGSLMAAEPQFYIAVGVSGDIGGPALDIFNLRSGVRLGFMPRAEMQPARGFIAADIGLRINPIQKQVYVDLTTGAFIGANFSDLDIMAGIANRVSAGYRGDRFDLGLDLNYLYDFVAGENLVIVGVRGGIRW